MLMGYPAVWRRWPTRIPGHNVSEKRLKNNELGPGVYIFKRDEELLYVGSTGNLNQRPNQRAKKHASRCAAILASNGTQLIPCESVLKAKQMEEQLIRKFRPIYNLRNPRAQADLERTERIIRENW